MTMAAGGTPLDGLQARLVTTIGWEFSDLIRYDSPTGRRVAWRIARGRAEGPSLSADVADQGGELLVLRPDGTLELDSRMMWRLDDGRLVYWRARGIVRSTPQAATDFFATGILAPQSILLTPYFDTPPDDLAWLTRHVFVAVGELSHTGATLRLFAVGGEE